MNDDQRAAWRRALSAKAKANRNRHGKRERGIATVAGPGMVRVNPTPARTAQRSGNR